MRERGQTIPFWTFAAIAMLAMMLTVWNYGAQVYWNVRAQTAADSAAASGLSIQANIWNEESTIGYAAAVDEYRLRALNQGILNTLNQNGDCNVTSTTDPLYCGTVYTILVNAYTQAAKNYGADIQLMAQADQFTSTYGMVYRTARGQLLSGTQGFLAAMRAGYFRVIIYNNTVTSALDKTLAAALQADPDYRFAGSVPENAADFRSTCYVWVRT